jgi:hypothetical protein
MAVTTADKQRIEKAFFKRMEHLKIKPGTKEYKNAQNNFFLGAMVALNDLNYSPWGFSIVTGRDIVSHLRKEQVL